MTIETDLPEMDEVVDRAGNARSHPPLSSPDASSSRSRDALVGSDEGRSLESLPRLVSGGFDGLAADLDRRSRDWTMMVRLLEQQRVHLQTAEAERDRLYDALQRVMPEVMGSGAALRDTMETAKSGDLSGDLSERFSRNLRALDELENLAQALSANLLWTRSSWEQYARSVIGAQKMRAGGAA